LTNRRDAISWHGEGRGVCEDNIFRNRGRKSGLTQGKGDDIAQALAGWDQSFG
jgi:hypothetical protein